MSICSLKYMIMGSSTLSMKITRTSTAQNSKHANLRDNSYMPLKLYFFCAILNVVCELGLMQ